MIIMKLLVFTVVVTSSGLVRKGCPIMTVAATKYGNKRNVLHVLNGSMLYPHGNLDTSYNVGKMVGVKTVSKTPRV